MNMKWVLGLTMIVALMLVSCKPAIECGNSICSLEKGETAVNCPADCKAQQQEAVVSISPASIEVLAGDAFTLEVMVDGVNNLSGFQFNINYDPNVLQFSDAQQGTFLSESGTSNTFCVDNVFSPGFVKNIACAKVGGAGVSGSGLLDTISFKALASGTTDVALSNVKLVASGADTISSSFSNGKVIVS